MQIVATVVRRDITERDLDREKSCGGDAKQALKRLIDRCLLLAKAEQLGIISTDEEFDIALLEVLEQDEPFGLPQGAIHEMDAVEIERLIKSNITIRKYISRLHNVNVSIPEKKLLEFYMEKPEYFRSQEMVRCSHIFLKGEGALEKITKIRAHIKSPEDFIRHCRSCSQCPSSSCCGDLGYFPRGKLFKEIDDVAFSLRIDEISQPFASPEGYHILMLTDRKMAEPVPFEDIKHSLSEELCQMQQEYCIMRHLEELYQEFQSQITIFDEYFKQDLGKLGVILFQ